MKAFFQNYGPQIGQLAFVLLLLGSFIGSAIFVPRAPSLPTTAAKAVEAPTPQLSSFSKLPPPRKAKVARKVKRQAEPRFEAPRMDEVRAMPMDSISTR